jgi:hypothetical protein
MKVTNYQMDKERSVLTGMIVSDRVLARIYSSLKKERKPFRSKWSNVIAGWCLKYFKDYGKAPGKDVESLFRDYATKTKEGEVVELIERFLSGLSDEHKRKPKELNEDYLMDSAAEHFNLVRLERLGEAVQAAVLRQDLKEAREAVAVYAPVNLALSDMVDVSTNKVAMADALSQEEDEVLIHYPKDLGRFFGPHLQRDGFIAFMAPEKRGKSFWLMDLAWRSATRDHRRTLLYSVGDMSQHQILRRLAVRAARRPRDARKLKVPVELVSNEPPKGHKGEWETVVGRKSPKNVHFKSKEFPDAISLAKDVWPVIESVQPMLKLKCTSNSSTTVADIRADIEGKIQEGWIPDVVVIDYADILAPEIGVSSQDYRHQINTTWQALRRLSQDFHVLVVTATQSDASSYGAYLLRREHFSEDKRKFSHVTGIVGINQTEEEKRDGLFRLNWIALREGLSYESRCVHVAGCLAIANPAIVSAW